MRGEPFDKPQYLRNITEEDIDIENYRSSTEDNNNAQLKFDLPHNPLTGILAGNDDIGEPSNRNPSYSKRY
jgi:hypothetical protein